MFARARIRLTILYIALFTLVLGAFSVIFYVAISSVLAPAFDLAPEVSTQQAAEQAYRATIERIGLALVVGDLLVIGLVGVVAWILATRTLRPIREAHVRQRRFVADASHEIRTPLSAIRATAESAAEGASTVGDFTTALGSIIVSADRLTRLTNDLLMMARTDERLLGPRPEPMDLSVAAAEAMSDVESGRSDATRARLDLTPDLLVSADHDDIRRILANLLDNALRYGGPSVAVRMASSGSEREAVVAVSDDGPGIAATDLERIFEPFYRVRADATSPDGTGLGLALARSLSERNGGRLTVESEPGAGSTFRLVLPRFR